jgi:hypothetical protein
MVMVTRVVYQFLQYKSMAIGKAKEKERNMGV